MSERTFTTFSCDSHACPGQIVAAGERDLAFRDAEADGWAMGIRRDPCDCELEHHQSHVRFTHFCPEHRELAEVARTQIAAGERGE